MGLYTILKNFFALKSLWVTVIAFCAPLPLVILNIEGKEELWRVSLNIIIIIKIEQYFSSSSSGGSSSSSSSSSSIKVQHHYYFLL